MIDKRQFGRVLCVIGIAALVVALAWLALFFFLTTSWGDVDEDMVLSQKQASELTLLDPDRKLPSEARNVHVRFMHWQDSRLFVRFEAPLSVATAFATSYIERDGQVNSCGQITYSGGQAEQLPCPPSDLEPGCGFLPGEEVGDWWLQQCPAGSVNGSAMLSDDPPARKIVIVPRSDQATVYISTFTF